jgi:hypothetical protein
MRSHVLAVSIVAMACGGSGSSDAGDASLQALNALSLEISAAAAAYGAQAGSMPDVATCASQEDAYHADVHPKVQRMQGMGPELDGIMSGMGHHSEADIGCAADAMMAELEHHHGAACASATDMDANRAEAQRHVTAMTEWADHQRSRSHDMGAMGGGGMTTGHCVHHDDGRYELE